MWFLARASCRLICGLGRHADCSRTSFLLIASPLYVLLYTYVFAFDIFRTSSGIQLAELELVTTSGHLTVL